MTSKIELRAELRHARRAAPRVSLPVPAAFTALLTPGCVVASYQPIGGEADPSPFVRAARATGCALASPQVTAGNGAMRFLRWDADARLVTGPFGLAQPADDMDELRPSLILTPLVGFDRQGNRLGQGQGYYDRAFAALPGAMRIGIAYAVQEVPSVPADPWDEPLHHIATELEWITP